MKVKVLILCLLFLVLGCKRIINPQLPPAEWKSAYVVDKAYCKKLAYNAISDAYIDSLPKYAEVNWGALLEGFNKGFSDGQKRQDRIHENNLRYADNIQRDETFKAMYEACMSERGWTEGRIKDYCPRN